MFKNETKLFLSIFTIFIFTGYVEASDLQTLIDKADAGNKIITLEKNKIYKIDKSLVLYNDITINGNGATLTQSENWKNYNNVYEPLLRMVNIKNVKINNLVFDHAVFDSKPNNQPFSTILMFGAQDCLVERCTFKNLGGPYDSKYVKGSPFILMISQDNKNDFTYLPDNLKSKLYSTNNNVIKSCKFINNNTYISFAIRVLTQWTKNTSTEDVINKTQYNKILNCEFIGEYDWNTVELAGPGVIHNEVSNNIIDGKSVNNLDIDKGASFNVFRNNIIKNSGLPSRHFFKLNVRFAAIAVHGSSTSLIGRNNLVENNTINNLRINNAYQKGYLYSSAIQILYTDNTTIKGNIIDNIFDKEIYGVGILIDQYNTNIIVENNKIVNAYRGIYESLNSRKNILPKIKNNTINVKKEKIFLKPNN
ncbi:right-handed parallel beta-helix repeat-containing protein [Chryseobacterium indoltheticum]|uniref:Right handed beta helix domain-containing protein n=1 Tax=Chryseobacterium indoltheticum TaxID=254 RepID=A0A381FPB6_9FLAO|nr:hypothetical protein [Chryseobacterium indoltheticum]SUX48410.1 Uncharacterised protein [Chryseobacterium indoltheticum]